MRGRINGTARSGKCILPERQLVWGQWKPVNTRLSVYHVPAGTANIIVSLVFVLARDSREILASPGHSENRVSLVKQINRGNLSNSCAVGKRELEFPKIACLIGNSESVRNVIVPVRG